MHEYLTTFMFLMMLLIMKMTTRIMTFCWPKANDIYSSLYYGYSLVDSVACSSHTIKYAAVSLLSLLLRLATQRVSELSVTFGNAVCC